MLAPRVYATDCLKLVGKIIDCRDEYYTDNDKTLTLWKETYPDAPLELDVDETPKEDFEYESTLSYDVMAAVLRQKLFNYQVSLPHYTDNTFIDLAIERYKKFLYMRLKHKNLFVVPTYDMDIVWHTHQVHPVLYKEDTERILGEHLHHDDSVNDRKPGSKLDRSSAATGSTWREMYADDYSSFGCMFRGNPTNGKLSTISNDPFFKLTSKNVHIELKNIEIKCAKLKPKKIEYIKADFLHHKGWEEQPYFHIMSPPDEKMCWFFNEFKQLEVETDGNIDLNIELGRKPSFMKKLKGADSVVSKGVFKFKALTDDLEKRNVVYEKSIEIPLKGDHTSTIIMNLLVTATSNQPMYFGTISSGPQPTYTKWPKEDRESFWGPIPFATIKPTAEDVGILTNK